MGCRESELEWINKEGHAIEGDHVISYHSYVIVIYNKAL